MMGRPGGLGGRFLCVSCFNVKSLKKSRRGKMVRAMVYQLNPTILYFQKFSL